MRIVNCVSIFNNNVCIIWQNINQHVSLRLSNTITQRLVDCLINYIIWYFCPCVNFDLDACRYGTIVIDFIVKLTFK